MKYDKNSVYYIELHYNFARYKIYNIMVENYEEFWRWLTDGESEEFVIKSSTNRDFKYIRSKISNFYEKQNENETARSKEITKLKNSYVSIQKLKENCSFESFRFQNKINPPAEKNIQIPSANIERYETDKILRDLEYEQRIQYEKSRNDKLSMELEILSQKILDLEDIISSKTNEIEEQRNKIEIAEHEVNFHKAQVLRYKSEANQQVKTNDELHQQLVSEQLRAEKAENDLAALVKMLSGLNDKYYNECNSFLNQFKQIVEEYDQHQPEDKL